MRGRGRNSKLTFSARRDASVYQKLQDMLSNQDLKVLEDYGGASSDNTLSWLIDRVIDRLHKSPGRQDEALQRIEVEETINTLAIVLNENTDFLQVVKNIEEDNLTDDLQWLQDKISNEAISVGKGILKHGGPFIDKGLQVQSLALLRRSMQRKEEYPRCLDRAKQLGTDYEQLIKQIEKVETVYRRRIINFLTRKESLEDTYPRKATSKLEEYVDNINLRKMLENAQHDDKQISYIYDQLLDNERFANHKELVKEHLPFYKSAFEKEDIKFKEVPIFLLPDGWSQIALNTSTQLSLQESKEKNLIPCGEYLSSFGKPMIIIRDDATEKSVPLEKGRRATILTHELVHAAYDSPSLNILTVNKKEKEMLQKLNEGAVQALTEIINKDQISTNPKTTYPGETIVLEVLSDKYGRSVLKEAAKNSDQGVQTLALKIYNDNSSDSCKVVLQNLERWFALASSYSFKDKDSQEANNFREELKKII